MKWPLSCLNRRRQKDASQSRLLCRIRKCVTPTFKRNSCFGSVNLDAMSQIDALDVEFFIDQIKKRPALWDSSCEAYKDRLLKKDMWREICEIMIVDFDDKSEAEKIEMGRTLQLKWKNIRDAFVRSCRHVKKAGEESNKPVKPYVYAKVLEFLRKDIESALFARSHYSTFKEELMQDDFEETQTELMQTEPSVPTIFKGSKRRQEDPLADNSASESQNQNFHVEHYEVKNSESSEYYETTRENDDAAFFRSLQPMLQTLSNHQKISFRIEVMKLLSAYMNPK